MEKRVATFSMKSIDGSELFFGKYLQDTKNTKETHVQFEERTWQQKIHRDAEGHVFIQPFALKNALESAAKWLSMPIPGEGKKTFTKRFVSGSIVVNRIYLYKRDGSPVMLDDVEKKTMPVPSDGQRGGKKRVIKIFPRVQEWTAQAEVILFDEKITEEVLQEHLEAIGNFIGFGSMRVENGGINGRFEVSDLKISA